MLVFFVLVLFCFFVFFNEGATLREAGAASPVSRSLWWISAEEAFVPANRSPQGEEEAASVARDISMERAAVWVLFSF